MMKLTNMLLGMKDHLPAEQLLQAWEMDPGKLLFWRASSNFVYQVKDSGETYYLRFIREDDNSACHIEAELDFVEYLAEAGYPAAPPVRSRRGLRVESVTTESGTFYGSLFRAASGQRKSCGSMSEEQLHRWGQSLARLHLLSEAYEPPGAKRSDWRERLVYIRDILDRHPQETAAAQELDNLANLLDTLPAGTGSIGLIHYDFESDNVTVPDAAGLFGVYDFDDLMEHWYAMDAAIVLKEIEEERELDAEEASRLFLDGYRSIRPLTEHDIEQMPLFIRFDELYGFARILRSLEGIEPPDQPDWMIALRAKFRASCDRKRAGFASVSPSGTIEESPRR